MAASNITALFLDVGGVLLTNGWDSVHRQRAAERFALDLAELNERHHLTFDTYELPVRFNEDKSNRRPCAAPLSVVESRHGTGVESRIGA